MFLSYKTSLLFNEKGMSLISSPSLLITINTFLL